MANETPHVLLAEGNDVVAAAKMAELEGRGYSVRHVSNATDAAAAIQDATLPVDLVLIDIELAGELARMEEAVATLTKADIPVLFLLSADDRAAVEQTSKLMPLGVVARHAPIGLSFYAVESALRLCAERREVTRQRRCLRNMGSHAKLGTWEYDPQSSLFHGSDAVYAVFDRPVPASGDFGDIFELYAGQSSERLERAIDLAIEHGTAFILDSEINTRAGKHKWIRIQGQADSNEGSEPRRLFGTIQDISEIRLQARVKQETELTLNQVEQITHIGHWSVSIEDGSFFHSDEIKRIFGYEPSEYALSVEDAINAYHPGDREEVIRLFNRAVETGDGYEFDLRVVQPSGAIRYVHSKGYTDKDEAGKVVRVYGVFQDITDQLRGENALRESEASMKALVDAVSTGIVVHDETGEVILSNQMANQSLAPLAKSIVGREIEDSVWRFIHEDGTAIPVSDLPVSQILRTGEPVKNLIIGFHDVDGGRDTWVLVNGTPVKDSSGELLKVIVSFADITSLKEMEGRLHQSEKMKAIGQLAGGVAHDFNNQLAGMLTFAELAREEIDDSSAASPHLCEVISGISRAADLNKQLLAFARKGKYVVTAVDMNSVVAEVASMVSHSFDKRIRITTRADANPGTIAGDVSQLHNAILNIALNSRDAMPNGGELIFGTELVTFDEGQLKGRGHDLSPGEFLKVTVTDTGTGMTAEAQKHVFEPFFTTKGHGKGVGMGMASVYGTVQNHHGAIEIDGALGRGTTVTLYFPLFHGQAQDNERPASKSETPGGRILIVDDEDVVARSMKALLDRKGYQTTTCASGREAIDLFERSTKTIDLVLLDMNMPGMNGEQTFRAMKALDPTVKVMLLSGYSLTDETRRLLDDGAVEFLTKPVLSKDLFQSISDVLGAQSVGKTEA